MKIQAFAVCCSLVLSLPAMAQDAAVKPVTVPFTYIESGHFMVTVKLNGKGPYNLIFDTGAPMTLIDNRIAKDSGVAKGGGGFMPFGAMGAPQSIAKLEIGDLTAEKIPTMVMDHPTVSAFSKYYQKQHGQSIDGILGFPFFARFATTVNYQTKELKFTPNGYKPADLMQSLMNTMLAGSQGKPTPKVLAPQGYWGLSFAAKSADEAAGLTINSVAPGSPAAKAGLRSGDRLLTVDGRWTDSVADAYTAAGSVKLGSEAEVVVQRAENEKTLKLVPALGF